MIGIGASYMLKTILCCRQMAQFGQKAHFAGITQQSAVDIYTAIAGLIQQRQLCIEGKRADGVIGKQAGGYRPDQPE